MKKKILTYVKITDQEINDKKKITKERLEEHIMKTRNYQHERLIHLLVTIFVGLSAILFLLFALLLQSLSLLLIFILLLILFIPYILYYHFLENTIQKMYDQYDQLKNNTPK